MEGVGQSGNGRGDRARIEDRDSGEAGKVADVEGEEMGEAMRPQSGHDPRIMGDFAFAVMRGDERPPLGEEVGRVVEEGKCGLQEGDLGIDFRGR